MAFLSGSSVGLLMLFPGLSTGVLRIAASLCGLLVLAPFINKGTHRLLRIVALILSSVIAQSLVIFLSVDLGNYWGLGDLELIINVLIGSMLICVATGLIAPIRLNLRYVTHAAGAGLLSGVVFYLIVGHLWSIFCFDPCPWYNDLVFVSGWIFWYMAVCVAIYFGENPRTTI